jgi:hypothetical protein
MPAQNVTSIEAGKFQRLTTKVLVLFAKVKRRRKELQDKEKRIADQIKSVICEHPDTVYKLKEDAGTNGDIEEFHYGPRECPYEAVLQKFFKKESLDYKAECQRLYEELYKKDAKKKWKEFLASAGLEETDSLDIDVNPRYKSQ